MFDLDEAVRAWRRRMIADGLKEPGVLNELESHLWDDVAEQMRAGADASQAFAAAVRRLGEPSRLQAEFNKAGATGVRRLQAVALAGGSLLYLGVASFGLLRQDLNLNAVERLVGLGALVCATLLVLGLRATARRVRVGARARQVLAVSIVIPGIAWMMGFAFLVLPQLDLLPGQLVVALLWAMNPTIACGAFGWGLEESKAGRAD